MTSLVSTQPCFVHQPCFAFRGLLKISSTIDDSLPLPVIVSSLRTKGSSTTSNQLVVGSIIVRAIKSMIMPSLPLRVYGPIRSTHNALHGTVITVLDGRCPYLSLCFLLVWHVLHDFVSDRIVVRIPSQYIVDFIVSSSQVCPGCCK
jgi:hypothetical protein